MLNLKMEAQKIFLESLKEIDVRVAVSRNLSIESLRLSAAGRTFDLQNFRKIILIAVGKAASPMYEATIDILRLAGSLTQNVEAIVISPDPPARTHGAIKFFLGAHPTPCEVSRQAAIATLDLLHTAGPDTLVLFLVSGGSSSMMELPLDQVISLEDVADFNRVLVGSGLPIKEMNLLRKHLSAVKGGRLAAAAASSAQCTLILSDVPGDSLDTVGSGPSLPDSSFRKDRMEVYRRLWPMHRLPLRIERFFEEDSSAETPKFTDPAFKRAVWTSILSSGDLASSAARLAAAAGFHVEIDSTCDDWPSYKAANYLLDQSRRLRKLSPRSCLVSVGEVAVTLKGTTGQGGRNQHFALECALRLAERDDDSVVLSAGSDGIDGHSPAAGAVVDRHTCHRATLQGMNPAQLLAEFNSFALFQALGDAIITGSTGNNLRDLRLFLTQ